MKLIAIAASATPRELVREIESRENLDGIKLYLGEIGWVMLRASGTEPMLRVYSETRSAAATRKILKETRSIVERM